MTSFSLTSSVLPPPPPSALLSHFLARLAAMVAIVAATAQFFTLIEPVPLFWVIGSVVLMLLVALVAAGIALRTIWREGSSGLGELSGALLWAVPVLAVLAFGAAQIVANPPLTEVSTDPAEPPRFFPAENASFGLAELRAQIMAWPDLTGRRYASSPGELETALRQIIAENGWVLSGQFGTLETDGEMTLLIEGRAGILLLPMRAAVRITEEGETSYVDIRSQSLVGSHDFGANEAVITRMLDDLSLALQPGIEE